MSSNSRPREAEHNLERCTNQQRTRGRLKWKPEKRESFRFCCAQEPSRLPAMWFLRRKGIAGMADPLPSNAPDCRLKASLRMLSPAHGRDETADSILICG